MESNERPPETPLLVFLVVIFICATIGMLVAAMTAITEVIIEAGRKLRNVVRDLLEEGYVPRTVQKILHLLISRMDRKDVHAG